MMTLQQMGRMSKIQYKGYLYGIFPELPSRLFGGLKDGGRVSIPVLLRSLAKSSALNTERH